jgi:hypothetical protein
MNYNSLTFWLLFLAVLLPYWQYAHRRPAAPSQPSFHKLGHLLAEARANGMRVVVVALPTAPSLQYEIPDGLVATVAEAGMTFLDDRFTPALSPDLFPDGLHLADEGKAIYTRLLAAELIGACLAGTRAPGERCALILTAPRSATKETIL